MIKFLKSTNCTSIVFPTARAVTDSAPDTSPILHEVRIVGHSYSGLVATAVADRVPERIAEVIYLDAFVPENGQSMLDLMPPGVGAEFGQQVQTLPDGRQVLPPRRFEYFGRRVYVDPATGKANGSVRLKLMKEGGALVNSSSETPVQTAAFSTGVGPVPLASFPPGMLVAS